MNRRRRYAGDFTDSINSLQYSTSSEIDSCTPCSLSIDSLDDERTRKYMSKHSTHSCKHSIILASSSTKDSFMLDTPALSVTSVRSEPDLNKRINLFQGRNLKEQYQYDNGFVRSCNKGEDKENCSPRCGTKDKQLQNRASKKLVSELTLTAPKKGILQLHKKLESDKVNEASKRDSNYNIHGNKFDAVPVSEENITSKNFEYSQVTNETKKFETLLCSLDTRLNETKEASNPQQILKRLSSEYVLSPRKFNEKLVTITEESIINNGDDICNLSAVNLSRLTAELRKICKFIEDEPSPEWPSSPLSTPPSYLKQMLTSPICNKSIPVTKNEQLLISPVNSLPPSTPLSAIDVIKKRFFQKISKNNCDGNTNDLINASSNISSTESFERLEVQCKRLFPDEKECFQPLQRSVSVPSLLSMTEIENICEEQMALLDVSNTSDADNTILSTPNLLDMHLHQSSLMNNSKNEKESSSKLHEKSMKISENSDINMANDDKITCNCISLDIDDLKQTLLEDIAKKRKRCLDTARLIKEINADIKLTEEEKSLGMSLMLITENESNSLTCDEAKFLKTLTVCKDYQTYLEKQKPIFNLLMNSDSRVPETTFENKASVYFKNDEEIKSSDADCFNMKLPSKAKKNILSPNVKYTYRSPLLRNRNKETKEETQFPKAKLFFTPGKTPPGKHYIKKKIYFPAMYSPTKDTKEENISKNSHARGPRKTSYNTVTSPIGMYIRGTDMQLIKNIHAKTDDVSLQFVKRNDKASSNRNSKQTTKSQNITNSKTQGDMSMKVNLSSKLGTHLPYKKETSILVASEVDSTHKSHFLLPKVSYKLPLQVKTIKETKSPRIGARVKKLLESTENKVVIRHQGRINSIQKQKNAGIIANNEVLEINYEPEDQSIHIEQAANKTNFIHKKRNI
ncbi:uncharacterized protein LOC122397757 [Colletes gigas]|uniref:uncharacterized protein LOC122397757 n=1 Tax=Colletes gigas TaxID=935657 RepID=UPI001C9AEBAE|nr:uncharacterized protein LOC122397757 [Colletes gigas]